MTTENSVFGFLESPTATEAVGDPEARTAEQQMLLESVRDFMEKEVLPRTEALERGRPEVMGELLRDSADVGLTGIGIPERFGGIEIGLRTGMLIAGQLGKQLSFSTSLGAHIGIGSFPLVLFGSEELKQRYLEELSSAERIGAYALTEPDGGSDALNPKTRAEPHPDGGWVIDGQKQFITNAGIAGLYTVFADVDGEFTAFLVPAEAEGLEAGDPEKKMGRRGSPTGTLTLDGVRVPEDHVVGDVGKGHRVALNTLNAARIKLGYGGVGCARHVAGMAARYAADRTQFGQSIAEFELIRSKFAGMSARIFLLDSLCHRVVSALDSRLPPNFDHASAGECCDILKCWAVPSALIKIYASEMLDEVVDEAVQIHGGYGYMEEYPVCRVYRDVRADRIFEGTNEVNRLLAARGIFKAGMAGDISFPELIQTAQSPPPGPAAGPGALCEGLRWCFARFVTEAANTYGTDMEEQQDVVAGIVDLVTRLLLLDTARARVETVVAQADRPRRDLERAQLAYATEYVRGEVLPIAVELAADICPEDAGDIAAALAGGARDVTEARDHVAGRLVERT